LNADLLHPNNSMMLTETFFDNQRQALEEASRVRATAKDGEVIVRIDKSPYGGYRLRIIPTDVLADMLDSGTLLPVSGL
jgi:hypothetical protein